MSMAKVNITTVTLVILLVALDVIKTISFLYSLEIGIGETVSPERKKGFAGYCLINTYYLKSTPKAFLIRINYFRKDSDDKFKII